MIDRIRHVFFTIRCAFSKDCHLNAGAFKDDPLVKHFEDEAERALQETEVINRRVEHRRDWRDTRASDLFNVERGNL